jgi:RimJ/RimL family protein N-acetyltransferase
MMEKRNLIRERPMPDLTIKNFSDPKIYQSTVIEYLLSNEAENNLPLGILANIISGEYLDKKPYLALVDDGGNPCLVALCTPPFPVLFSYREVPPSREILTIVLEDLGEKLSDDFRGITGNKSLVTEMVGIWQDLTGVLAKLKMAMRIYKLEQVIPVTGVSGKMRPMTRSDEELVLEWYANFHRDGLGEEPDPAQVERQVIRYRDADPLQRGLMIWEVEGEPVSMAGYTGPTPHGIRVGAVYTPSHQRGKGYASACTAGLSQHLLDLGFKFCFLFTDLLNPTSNHIYQQIGYAAVCDMDRYDFAGSGSKDKHS